MPDAAEGDAVFGGRIGTVHPAAGGGFRARGGLELRGGRLLRLCHARHHRIWRLRSRLKYSLYNIHFFQIAGTKNNDYKCVRRLTFCFC